jgi:large subunit ribosomal protein L2
MGTRTISRRRGTGTSVYRANSHKSVSPARHSPVKDAIILAKVIDLVHSPGHNAPLAKLKFTDGNIHYILACEKLAVGSDLEIGPNAKVSEGNTLPIGEIPAGSFIYNIESKPGDGGKFARSSGAFARVLSRMENKVTIAFPSKKQKVLNSNCRATLGVVAGGGRLDKPILKAGKKHHAAKARGRLYPRVSGVAMNACDHPFGSGRGRHRGRCSIPKRHSAPGKKVGQIRARRTGKKN